MKPNRFLHINVFVKRMISFVGESFLCLFGEAGFRVCASFLADVVIRDKPMFVEMGDEDGELPF